jgi:ABC-2 type transport system permease protein
VASLIPPAPSPAGLTVTAAAPAVGRQPRAIDFARLKLRLLRNGMRGQTGKTVLFVLGLVVGLFFGVSALIGLGATGEASTDVGLVVASFTGTGLLLAWSLIPLLFFGVDETIDPARFALLPLRHATITRGMLLAAMVGIPALATLLASAGLVVAAGIRFGSLATGVALAGALAGLVQCVLASRAITSAFASLLRSRRMRDLAIVAIAVLASSFAPLQLVGMSASQHTTLSGAVRVARVLNWTPFGAPYALPFDVAAHDWVAFAGRAAIIVATIGLLLWWWSRTLESAMIGVASNAPASSRAGRRATAGGAVATLLTLRGLVRPNRFGAIYSRELRAWWRDARRRASVVSILMASVVIPVSIRFAAGRQQAVGETASGLTFVYAVSFAGVLAGTLLGNQFAFDGTAYWTHLLAAVPGRTELRARAAALCTVALPVQAAVLVSVAVLTHRTSLLPAGVGLLATAFGTAAAFASLLSVYAAYPLPDTTNPFAINSGAGSAKGLLALGGMLATIVLSLPVILASYFLSDSSGAWLVLVIGVAYGVGIALAGTALAGAALNRRGPELLIAVTPKR